MITVSFFRTEDRHIKGMECSGHAGAGEEGFDIVCSAVSALAINTVNALEEMTEVGFDEEAREDGGWLKVMLETSDDHDSQLLMRALELGIRQMAEAYPEYIRIRENDQ